VMYIVGFTGPIHHGKSTAAKMLLSQEPKSRHIESWHVIAEVAEKLNQQFDPTMISSSDLTSINSWLYHLLDILPDVVGVKPSFDQIEIKEHELDSNPAMFNKLLVYVDRLRDNPSLALEDIEDSNKEDHRPLLQWLGGYLTHNLSETLWYDEIMRRILSVGENVNLYTVSGLRYPEDAAVMRKHGAKIIEIIRPDYERSDQNDPTEAKRNLIEADSTIINDGNLDDLEDAIKAMWQDILADRLRFEYRGIN
jgi:hypothetical protein